MEQQFLDRKDGRYKTLAVIEAERAKAIEEIEAPAIEITKPVEGIEKFQTADDVAKESQEVKPAESELEKLKAMCDEKGIKFHHASGVKKLKELLNL